MIRNLQAFKTVTTNTKDGWTFGNAVAWSDASKEYGEVFLQNPQAHYSIYFVIKLLAGTQYNMQAITDSQNYWNYNGTRATLYDGSGNYLMDDGWFYYDFQMSYTPDVDGLYVLLIYSWYPDTPTIKINPLPEFYSLLTTSSIPATGFSVFGGLWRNSEIDSNIIDTVQGVSSPIKPLSNPYNQWEFSSNNIRTDYSSNCLHESFGQGEWLTNDSPSEAWLQWKNNSEKVLVRSYDIDNSYRGSYGATGWKLQGSDDEVAWRTIDSQSGIEYSSNTLKRYNCGSNNTKYYYHRIFIVGYAGFGCVGRLKTFKQAR